MPRPFDYLLTLILLLVLFIGSHSCTPDDKRPRVLIFNKTEFYFHESTGAGTEALKTLCESNGFRADVTEEGEDFTEEKLRQYTAVIFLNTAGDVLNYKQEAEFERFIQAGGGFVGIHTAVDTEHNWKWYGGLVGARFESQSEVEPATLRVEDRDNPSTQSLDVTWQRTDEWFNLQDVGSDVQVLLTVDENTYTGGRMGGFHPVSWYHEYDGGRAFVTVMGHTKESYGEPAFLQHLLGGLKYAIGNNTPLNYDKPHADAGASQVTTGAAGFTKTNLVCDLYEPMEFEMLPDGKILLIERRGAIKLFNPETGEIKVVDEIPVFIKHEEGLIGMALDPHYAENHWVYLYYTPEDNNEAVQLSRFVFQNETLDRASETVMLKVFTLKNERHYHAGGCIEFDARGNLYIATGDNTYHRDGYSSLDERPGEEAFDSQKSSSNSMDLRGKILRIRPLPDGSYICPAGNMYVERDIRITPGADPLLIDPGLQNFMETSMYAAAVQAEGKQAGDSSTMDLPSPFPFLRRAAPGAGRPEVFVMGLRNPYRLNFDDRRQTLYWGEPGPDAGVADSTFGPEGYDEINMAKTAGFYGWPYFVGPNKAYREYDFATNTPGPYYDPKNPENKSVNNTGTRYLPPSRMPLIYYPFSSTPDFPLVANGTRCAMAGPTYYCDKYPAETRFPDRMDGKLIVYEWMRNWIRLVTLDSTGRYIAMEPLDDDIRVSRPIDMFIDKKGSLWLLEYGTEWYQQNPDACLSRIDYTPGKTPGTVAGATSAPRAPLHWDFGNKNRSFYQPGDMVPYKVVFTDPAATDPTSVNLAIEYRETDKNAWAFARQYHPTVKDKNRYDKALKILEGTDCKSCHAVDRQVNGPAYLAVAERYAKDGSALDKLTQKVIKGGSGNWGDRSMSAHPQLRPGDVSELVRWILSLPEQIKEAVPLQGRYALNVPAGKGAGVFVFSATNHEQKGETLVLRPTTQQAESADSSAKGLRVYKRPLNAGTTTMTELKNGQFIAYKHIDLRGIKSLTLATEAAGRLKQAGGGVFELHLGTPDGPMAGSVAIPTANPSGEPGGLIPLELALDKSKLPGDGAFQDLYLVVKNGSAAEQPVLGVDWVRFEF